MMTEELPMQSATASVYWQRGGGGVEQRRETERTRGRERESSLKGGVKVLDNCSTKCAC